VADQLILESRAAVSAVPLESASGDSAATGRIKGVALPYNAAAHFPAAPVPVKVRPGAATASLIARARNPERDIMLVATHDDNRTLARFGAGTLFFSDSPEALRFSADLDLQDPEALSAYRKVANGSWSAASVRFTVQEYAEVQEVDNSHESATGDERVAVLAASVVDIDHVALVPQGAFAGASALAAEAQRCLQQDAVEFEFEGSSYRVSKIAPPVESAPREELAESAGSAVTLSEARRLLRQRLSSKR